MHGTTMLTPGKLHSAAHDSYSFLFFSVVLVPLFPEK